MVTRSIATERPPKGVEAAKLAADSFVKAQATKVKTKPMSAHVANAIRNASR